MSNLTQEQIEILYEIKRIKEDDDKGSPVVVDSDAIAALRAPLEEALADSGTVRADAQTVSGPENLSLEGLAGQFSAGDGEADDEKGTPVVVDADAINALREPLEDALAGSGAVRSPEELPIAALAGQFADVADDGDGEGRPTDALKDASQHPETGGAGPDEIDGDGSGDPETGEEFVESLSPGRAREAYREVKKVEQLSGRTPEYAETRREEIADDLGLDDPEDVPTTDEFQAVLQNFESAAQD